MSDFTKFSLAVNKQFAAMTAAGAHIFRADTDKDDIWDTYLNSFPEGTNPVFLERTEYDCNCCKSFIRAGGNAVSIINGELISIWDVVVPYPYQDVANALSAYVKSKEIRDVYLSDTKQLGNRKTHQDLGEGKIKSWDHFYFTLPSKHVRRADDIGTVLSELRANKEVFKRGLDEITQEAVDLVIELVDQGSLYRGEEYLPLVQAFSALQTEYRELANTELHDLFCWERSLQVGGATCKLRNTSIGSLLVDLSSGVELDAAVRMFESKVAPTNYKRPSAVVTKGMIVKAEKKVAELGISESLQRRYAVTTDITANNILFADRSVKAQLNVFDELKQAAPTAKKSLAKVEEISIDDFIDKVLPKAETVELFLENSHNNNLMSLIAPINPEAPPIFKWGNNFSWSYEGEVTDSIKERVKAAGGNVSGVLRCSLSWFNYDDLDLHVIEPNGTHIYYRRSSSPTSGRLDVDMNAGGARSRNAVENIVWTNKDRMLEGEYQVYIDNFSVRESKDVGFDVEIEFAGETHVFHYPKAVKSGTTGNVQVAKFKYSKKSGLQFLESLPQADTSKEMWGLPSQQFHKVSTIMYSPNHWDDKAVGNKHIFFTLEGCVHKEKTRGFYNEFLMDELSKDRKVFEVLGSKMRVDHSDDQLSGVGFSSTKRDSVICKVSGSFNRTLKVLF